MSSAASIAFVPPDAALVRAAAGGDRAAFGELYQKYARVVNAVLLARVNPSDVPDLLQDVFVQAMQQLPRLREPAAFSGWLVTIARNRATDHLRRSRPQTELLDVHCAPGVPAETLGALRAIRALPDAYRETMLMRLVHGFTGPEIAAVTGMTHESVRVNLSRGMKMLRAQLGDHHE